MKNWALLLALLAGQVPIAGPVELKKSSDLPFGVEAMPRVVGGVSPEVAAKINAAFDRLDAKVLTAAADCRKNYQEQMHQRLDDAWSRGVQVTMRGPRYLSLVANDSLTCGGAHPDMANLPLVYDLKTGGTVNWLKLLPAGATSGTDEAADGSKVGAVIWPVLTALERKGADGDCKDLFTAETAVPFLLWLDAGAGAIQAAPESIPHAMLPCASTVQITVAQARKMGGFDKEMLDALEAAHGLQKQN